MRTHRDLKTFAGLLMIMLSYAFVMLATQFVSAQEAPATNAAPPAATKAEAKEAHADHGKHGGGHHDEHDLSHANAGENLLKPEEFKSDLAIYTFVVFILLMTLLTKFAWGPISNGLAKREQHIADMIAEAKHNAEKSERTLLEYQKKVAAAQEETRELLAQARRDGELLKDKIISEAQALAQRERDRAVQDINAAKNAALHEIAQKSVDTAVSLAGRILRKEVRPQEHAQLIRESLDKFPSSN